jgi:fibronectin type 3 domain-containing protein
LGLVYDRSGNRLMPDAPTNLDVTAILYNKVSLSWQSAESYDHIKVYRDSVLIDTITGDPEAYDDNTAAEKTTYSYFVTGVIGGSESSASNSHGASTPITPPLSFAATAQTKNSIWMSWTLGSTYDLIEYGWYAEGDSEWSGGPSYLSGGFTSTSVGYLAPWTLQHFRIRGVQNSPLFISEWAYLDAYTAPEEVTGLTATVTGFGIQLGWTNNGTYDLVRVYRKPAGGSYSEIGSTTGDRTNYQDITAINGVTYYYKVYADCLGILSIASNEASNTPSLHPPWYAHGTCLSKTSVKLTWTDINSTEDGHKIYMNGVYLDAVGANVTEYTATGLTAGAWYDFYVTAYNAVIESAPSNTVHIWTWDPPAAPDGLAARAISTTRVDLSWNDNSDNETSFRIERCTDGINYIEVADVATGVTHYSNTGLATNTLFYYRVRARNASGDSAYTAVATAQTFAAIARPTNVRAYARISGGVYCVEFMFDDNSELEDYHVVERKLSGGSFAVWTSLAPNREYARDASVSKGNTYIYRVRAKQGASSYSDYSDEVTVVVPADLTTGPAGFAASGKTAREITLSWTALSGAIGYSLEQSLNGSTWAECARVGVATLSYTVTRLSPSTAYWWRLRAYSYNNYSSYALVGGDAFITQTMLDSDNFDQLVRQTTFTPVVLCEINPLMRISGWTAAAGLTYTYKATFNERGAPIEAVYQNGVLLTVVASAAAVDALAGSYYFDFYARVLYVRTLGSDDPTNYFMTISFWLFFTNHKTATYMMDFGDRNYLALINTDDIPDISQEINPYYEGNFILSAGSFSLINGEFVREHYFDKKYAEYEWRNRQVIWRVGLESWTHAQFRIFFTGTISGAGAVSCDDQKITFSMRDLREGLDRTVPPDHLTTIEYPWLDANAVNHVKPYHYGTITDYQAICIDTTNRRYMIQDGRVASVSAVKQNGATLVLNTDYFINYRDGIISLGRSLTWTAEDIILVSFHGAVNDLDEEINTAGPVFRDVMEKFLALAEDQLDMKSIYETKAGNTDVLAVSLCSGQSSDEIIKRLEKTARAWTFQDERGRLGFRIPETTVPTVGPFVQSHQIWDFKQGKGTDSIYKTVEVNYLEDQTQKFSVVTKSRNVNDWLAGAKGTLVVKTYLSTEAQATALLDLILAELDKDFATFKTSFILFGALPGDLISFTRGRFYSMDGVADGVTLRLLRVSRQISSQRIEVRAEVV